MSLHHYQASKEIELAMYEHNWPFYGLIMTAMRRADDINLALLVDAFPSVYADLLARYNAPGGLLESDTYQKLEDNS